uniref:RLAN domain-containing protein n=1 Tax=Loa loa TaxID=7209 RepID=A0A1I7VCX2_LOALO
MQHSKDHVALAIVISNDLKYTYKRIKSEALTVADKIRKYVPNVPICIVAQSDNREKTINPIGAGRAFIFYGPDVSASTLVVDKNNTEMLRIKFVNWKKKLPFLNSHQLIAFHFTVVNGTEPEDSEEIFSNTFPDIPLSTLRLLDESSMTRVDHAKRFHPGPVYAIVGFRKFGGGVLPGKMFQRE